MHLRSTTGALLLALILTACAAPTRRPLDASGYPNSPRSRATAPVRAASPAPTKPVAANAARAAAPVTTPRPTLPTPAYAAPAPANAQGAIADAQERVGIAKNLLGGWYEADDYLNSASEALRRGDQKNAVAYARQAGALANAVTVSRYLELSRDELQKAYEFTGLSDIQVAQLKAVENLIAQGAGRSAYEGLQRITAQLRNGTKPYAVKAGDSLWIISGRPDIYGNPWLWPLIWEANLEVVAKPEQIKQGQMLKIRPNPTIDEVVKAVDYARSQVSTQTRIGEIREAQ